MRDDKRDMGDVRELRYVRHGRYGRCGRIGDVRGMKIGTCLTVFLTKVTDLLSDRTNYRDGTSSKKTETREGG